MIKNKIIVNLLITILITAVFIIPVNAGNNQDFIQPVSNISSDPPSSFDLRDFCKEHPERKRRKKDLQQQIVRLIEQKVLYQMGKDKFRVDTACLKNLYH